MHSDEAKIRQELQRVSKRLKTYGWINIVAEILLSPFVVLFSYTAIFVNDCTATSVFICTSPPIRVAGILLAIYYIGMFAASCMIISISGRLADYQYDQLENRLVVKEFAFCFPFMGLFLVSTYLAMGDCRYYFAHFPAPKIEPSGETEKAKTERTISEDLQTSTLSTPSDASRKEVLQKSEHYTERSINFARWALLMEGVIALSDLLLIITNCHREHSCIIGNLLAFPLGSISLALMIVSLVYAVISVDICQRNKIKTNYKPFIYLSINLFTGLVLIVLAIFLGSN